MQPTPQSFLHTLLPIPLCIVNMQFTVISLVGMLATTIASPMVATIDPSLAKRDVIGNLREGSDPLEVAVQPLVDFDSNGCYQTSAIDSSVRVVIILDFYASGFVK